jgi:hypothetical protein
MKPFTEHERIEATRAQLREMGRINALVSLEYSMILGSIPTEPLGLLRSDGKPYPERCPTCRRS